jgi:hypothetical protein
MSVQQIEEQTLSDIKLPPNLAYESEAVEETPAEVVEAPQAEPEVDWKVRAEEAEKARAGILRDLQEERRANRERDARLEEIRLALVERNQAAVEETPPPPKDDPVAYLDHQLGELRQRLDALGTMTIEQRQAAEQRFVQEREAAEAQRFVAAVSESARKKAAEVPDYKDAVQYGIGLLRTHLSEQGYSGDQLEAAVMHEFYGVAANATRHGQDPATAIYEAAKRFGYQPKAQQSTPATTAVAETVRKGAAAGKSLSNVGGSTRAGSKVTMADFLELPESAQNRIVLDREKWEQLNRTGEVYL